MSKTEFTIDRAVLRRVRIPLVEPFRISNGSVSVKEALVVELYAEDVVGYGEASPMAGSFYSAETPDSTWAALANDLIPDILHRTIQSPVSYAELLNDYTKEPFARAGIEGAVWYLSAAILNTTIGDLIGSSQHSAPNFRPVYSGLALGIYDSTEELLARMDRYLPDGYVRLKIKVQPGWDIEPLTAIRDRYPALPLMVDANGAYNYAEHAKHLRKFDRFELMMLEQPFEREALEDAAALARTVTTPICADESADSLDALEQIIQLEAADVINIKVQRVGGLWNGRRMHDRCERAGLDCWLGTMPELGIASAQSLALAQLPMFQSHTDVEASDRWFTADIVTPKITIGHDGAISMPDHTAMGEPHSPMGFSVDIAALERYTTELVAFPA